MTTIAFTVLAAITLAAPTLSVADDRPTDSVSKPNSYAPQPRTKRHIYGAPIQPPIVGHAKASHHNHAHKKASMSATTHDAVEVPAHHGKAKASP